MLKFITKKMYSEAVANGAETNLRKGVFPWHLKSVQDAIVMNQIMDTKGCSIAEIGGGDTRILPELSKHNDVYNIEKFEGADGGPADQLFFKDVNNIYAWVGDTKDLVEDASFDIIFSVSVIEHIPEANFPAFIEDCARILKPGGLMLHAVDAYVPDAEYMHNGYNYLDYLNGRMDHYRSAFDTGLFVPMEPLEIQTKSDLKFENNFISNPDNMMLIWNRVAPQLSELRENAQSISLIWAGKRAIDI